MSAPDCRADGLRAISHCPTRALTHVQGTAAPLNVSVFGYNLNCPQLSIRVGLRACTLVQYLPHVPQSDESQVVCTLPGLCGRRALGGRRRGQAGGPGGADVERVVSAVSGAGDGKGSVQHERMLTCVCVRFVEGSGSLVDVSVTCGGVSQWSDPLGVTYSAPNVTSLISTGVRVCDFWWRVSYGVRGV